MLEFGTAYDLPKFAEGYADDEEYFQPYRALKHWYIVNRRVQRGLFRNDDDDEDNDDDNNNKIKTDHSKNSSIGDADLDQQPRLPLPPDLVFGGPGYESCVLCGWLQPASSSSSAHVQPIFVQLDDLELWSVDRSRSYRGYWVYTNTTTNHAALYCLEEPDTVQPRRQHSANSNSNSSTPDLDSQLLPSQEQVHLMHRAHLGVISNLSK
jgi:hypothetical protein